MLGAMLGAHSACIATPESQFKTDALARRDMPVPLDIRDTLEYMVAHYRFVGWQTPVDLGAAEASGALTSYRAAVEWLVRLYATLHGKGGAAVWIDHSPENFRDAAALMEQFPDCRMIHIVRDGRAVAASIMHLPWGPNTPLATARFWMESLAFPLAAEARWGPGVVMQVKYEDLVREPEAQLRRLCEHVGVPFEPALLKADGFTPSYTKKVHQLVGTPPTISRVDAWRTDLSPRAVERFEFRAGGLLKVLGYEPSFAVPRNPTFWQNVAEGLTEFAKSRLNRRRRPRRLARELGLPPGINPLRPKGRVTTPA